MTLSRKFVYLLFPASQAAIVAFLLFCTLARDLPSWLLVVTVGIGVLCIPVDLLLFRALREAEEKDLAEERVRLLEEQLQAQKEYGVRLDADAKEARRIREDVAAELRSVDALLASQEVDKASENMMRAVDMMGASRVHFCEHRVVDALVSLKARVCEEEGIRTDFRLDVPDDLGIPSIDVCAAFSNVLDNAVHACREVASGERFIALRARVAGGCLVIDAENSCVPAEGAGRKAKDRSRGRGLAEHGWGLTILECLAERHEGSLQVAREGGVFRTSVMLSAAPARTSGE